MTRKYLLLTALVLAAGIAGCDYLPTETNKVKDAVRAVLLDPDSAKFSDIRKGHRDGVWCGLVNAKNKMGGYAGNKTFAYRPNSKAEKVDLAPEEEAPTQADFDALFLDMRLGIRTGKYNVDEITLSYLKLVDRCLAAKIFESDCGSESSPKKLIPSCDKVIDDDNSLLELFKDWAADRDGVKK